jgi:Protein of unknown function VcgC/VcgE (DUF2780)
MNIQSTIDQVAAKAGLDPQTAERAAGIILSVIQQEVDPALAAKVFAKLPGAAELAAANVATAGSGGFLSGFANTILGEKAGTLAAGMTQLQGLGLSLVQIETAVATLLSFVKATGGAGLAGKISAAIPGLASAV